MGAYSDWASTQALRNGMQYQGSPTQLSSGDRSVAEDQFFADYYENVAPKLSNLALQQAYRAADPEAQAAQAQAAAQADADSRKFSESTVNNTTTDTQANSVGATTSNTVGLGGTVYDTTKDLTYKFEEIAPDDPRNIRALGSDGQQNLSWFDRHGGPRKIGETTTNTGTDTTWNISDTQGTSQSSTTTKDEGVTATERSGYVANPQSSSSSSAGSNYFNVGSPGFADPNQMNINTSPAVSSSTTSSSGISQPSGLGSSQLQLPSLSLAGNTLSTGSTGIRASDISSWVLS